MKPKTKVIDVKEPPKDILFVTQYGIADKDAAQRWGEKNGHAVVYFLSSKQRAYADHLQVRVDVKAEEIESKSEDLLHTAEAAL